MQDVILQILAIGDVPPDWSKTCAPLCGQINELLLLGGSRTTVLSLLSIIAAIAKVGGCDRDNWIRTCTEMWQLVNETPKPNTKGGTA